MNLQQISDTYNTLLPDNAGLAGNAKVTTAVHRQALNYLITELRARVPQPVASVSLLATAHQSDGGYAYVPGVGLFIWASSPAFTVDGVAVILSDDGGYWHYTPIQPQVQNLQVANPAIAYQGDDFSYHPIADFAVPAPVGGHDRQEIEIEIIHGANNLNISWNSIFVFGDSPYRPTMSIVLNARDFVRFRYSAAISKWRCTGFTTGIL